MQGGLSSHRVDQWQKHSSCSSSPRSPKQIDCIEIANNLFCLQAGSGWSMKSSEMQNDVLVNMRYWSIWGIGQHKALVNEVIWNAAFGIGARGQISRACKDEHLQSHKASMLLHMAGQIVHIDNFVKVKHARNFFHAVLVQNMLNFKGRLSHCALCSGVGKKYFALCIM